MQKIKKSTIVRTAFLALALLNSTLTLLGLNPLPFSDEEIYELVSGAVTVAASLWAWWKNNSFTPAAIAADKVYEKIKGSSSISEETKGETHEH